MIMMFFILYQSSRALYRKNTKDKGKASYKDATVSNILGAYANAFFSHASKNLCSDDAPAPMEEMEGNIQDTEVHGCGFCCVNLSQTERVNMRAQWRHIHYQTYGP